MEHSDAGFPATRWSLIDALIHGSDRDRDSAMNVLAQTYWPAIYAYLRHSGKSQHQALELTQAFFTEVVLQRQLFHQADERSGSLRSFVIFALKRYAIDQHRRESPYRSPWQLPLDAAREEDMYQQDGETSEALFMRRWALAVLEEALRRCEAHYRATSKAAHWEAFESRIIRPSLTMQSPPSHESLARDLHLDGPASSVMAVRVVRKRLLTLIRQVIAESTKDKAEQEAEFRDILALVN